MENEKKKSCDPLKEKSTTVYAIVCDTTSREKFQDKIAKIQKINEIMKAPNAKETFIKLYNRCSFVCK